MRMSNIREGSYLQRWNASVSDFGGEIVCAYDMLEGMNG